MEVIYWMYQTNSTKPKRVGRGNSKKPITLQLDQRFTEHYLTNLDGRSKMSRLLKSRLHEMVENYSNGNPANLSYAQKSLMKRAIFTEAIIEGLELKYMDGVPLSLEEGVLLLQCNNNLSTTFNRLGIKAVRERVGAVSALEWAYSKRPGRVKVRSKADKVLEEDVVSAEEGNSADSD